MVGADGKEENALSLLPSHHSPVALGGRSHDHFLALITGLQLSHFSLVSSTVLPNKPWESLWSMY